MVQNVAVKHEFEAGLYHETTETLSLSVSPAVNGYLFRIREGLGREGEGCAPPLIS